MQANEDLKNSEACKEEIDRLRGEVRRRWVAITLKQIPDDIEATERFLDKLDKEFKKY